MKNTVTKTQERLEELRFYLTKMGEHEKKSPDFRYITDAFLMVGKALDNTMKQENGHGINSEFTAWYDKKLLELSSVPFFKKFLDARCKTAHQYLLPMLQGIKYVLAPFPQGMSFEEMDEIIEKGTASNILINSDGTKYCIFTLPDRSETRLNVDELEIFFILPEIAGSELMDLANDYFHKWNEVVQECHTLFSDSLP